MGLPEIKVALPTKCSFFVKIRLLSYIKGGSFFVKISLLLYIKGGSFIRSIL